MAQWWCLRDPICCAILAASGAAIFTALRRLDCIRQPSRRRMPCPAVVLYCLTGAVLAWGTVFGAVAVANELFPGRPTITLGVSLLLCGVVDVTTSRSRRMIFETVRGKLSQLLDRKA